MLSRLLHNIVYAPTYVVIMFGLDQRLEAGLFVLHQAIEITVLATVWES